MGQQVIVYVAGVKHHHIAGILMCIGNSILNAGKWISFIGRKIFRDIGIDLGIPKGYCLTGDHGKIG